jgi:hypothetical protein
MEREKPISVLQWAVLAIIALVMIYFIYWGMERSIQHFVEAFVNYSARQWGET